MEITLKNVAFEPIAKAYNLRSARDLNTAEDRIIKEICESFRYPDDKPYLGIMPINFTKEQGNRMVSTGINKARTARMVEDQLTYREIIQHTYFTEDMVKRYQESQALKEITTLANEGKGDEIARYLMDLGLGFEIKPGDTLELDLPELFVQERLMQRVYIQRGYVELYIDGKLINNSVVKKEGSEEQNLEHKKMSDLRKIAADKGIDFLNTTKKEELIKLINKHD